MLSVIQDNSSGRISFRFPDLSLSPLMPLVESSRTAVFVGVQVGSIPGRGRFLTFFLC